MKKVLIVVTSHSELGKTGKKTGYYLSEIAHPFMVLSESGIDVEFASIKGGLAPVDPSSLNFKDQQNDVFYHKLDGKQKLANTLKLSDVDPENYSAILFAGGHGTMWDFPHDQTVSDVASNIYENGGIVSAVCHGPAALVNIKLSDGSHLVTGKKVSAFSNAEEEAAGMTEIMPFSLESALTNLGAIYSKANLWQEKVSVDTRLITGQNPASAKLVAESIVKNLN